MPIDFSCSVCKIDVSSSGIEEYPYMLHDTLWSHVCQGVIPEVSEDGMLCIGCVERRLGRILTKNDFNDAPINDITLTVFARSPRLTSRQSPVGEVSIG